MPNNDLMLAKALKYAHIERERRFLLPKQPAIFKAHTELSIQDWYLIGSTLRLRRVEEKGQAPIFKLGQKIRIENASPATVAHTTMYLSEAEFESLVTLPTRTLEKTRFLKPIGELTLAVDEFLGELTGLVLAEIDLGVADLMPEAFPIDVTTEVTDDERFTGGALANTNADDLLQLLTDFGAK